MSLDYDELDLLTATSPTLASTSGHSATSVTSDLSPMGEPGATRTLRSRVNSTSYSTSNKRKRPPTVYTIAKKSKTDEKKPAREEKEATTVVVNSARAAIDTSRKHWLHRHRDLFSPLLPPKSSILDIIKRDVEMSGDGSPFVPFHHIHEQPISVVGGVMKDYQLHGLSFLVYMYKNGINCILGDEMGLGKTLQTLSLFAYIKDTTQHRRLPPHLVICPLSVLHSWASEVQRWLPSFETLRFHGPQSERTRLKDAVLAGQKFDICITTYEAYVAEASWFKHRHWTCCVLDEGHRIKNSGTVVAHELQGIGSLYRLLLTGTPIQNNLVELWGILHWLYSSVFTAASEQPFKDSFDLNRGVYSLPFLNAAQKLLSKIMLRRTKATVEISVPPREELTVFVPMTEAQRFWTYMLLTRMERMDLQEIFDVKLEHSHQDEIEVPGGGGISQNRWHKLMNLLLQLRLVCDHPYLLPNAEPEPYQIGEHLVAASSKLIVIDKLLEDLLPKGERVIIFSQWTKMLELLEEFMQLRNIPYAKLEGSTSRARRVLDIKLFQQEQSPYKVFLISTKAGGLGINLTRASTVIMFDSDWNPQNDMQAIARAHRIGQTKVVKVYRLICQGSVEDQMLDRIRRKLFLSVKVMGSENHATGDESSGYKADELLDILRKGSSALSSGIVGMEFSRFLCAPIQEIFDASREHDDRRIAKAKHFEGVKEHVDERLLQDAEEEERKLLMGVAQVQSRLFEGKVIKRPSNAEIASEWKELQKRGRAKRIVNVGGIEMIAEHMGPEILSPVGKTPVHVKRSRKKFETEDWCLYCRDGGELVVCTWCPRVFHAKCHGLSRRDVAHMVSASCSQHKCAHCTRATADAGGMLLRCRTCPQAFCEDCLPDEKFEPIGDELPEYLLLGYGSAENAYYIYCPDCIEQRQEEPAWWETWQQEFQEKQRKWEGQMEAASHST